APVGFVPPATPSFTDVPTSHAFYREIEWMAAQGIVTAGGAFGPSTNLQRQAAAMYLYRYDQLVGVVGSTPSTPVAPPAGGTPGTTPGAPVTGPVTGPAVVALGAPATARTTAGRSVTFPLAEATGS